MKKSDKKIYRIFLLHQPVYFSLFYYYFITFLPSLYEQSDTYDM